MKATSDQDRATKPRILLFSHKNIFEHLVWRCSFQEFEAVLQEIDSVDVLAPKPSLV